MASATTIEVEKVVKVKEKAFQLTLTPAEATTLVILLNVIGGDEKTTARKYTDDIMRALNIAGVIDPIVKPGQCLTTKGYEHWLYFLPGSLEIVERKQS